MAITYVSPTDDETCLTDTFDYDDNQLSEVNESSGYSLEIDYPHTYEKSVAVSYNNTVISNKTLIRQKNMVQITDSISTLVHDYYFDDNYNFQIKLEHGVGVTGAESLHYISDTLKASYPSISKSSPIHINLKVLGDSTYSNSASMYLNQYPTIINNSFSMIRTNDLRNFLEDGKTYLFAFRINQDKLYPSSLGSS